MFGDHLPEEAVLAVLRFADEYQQRNRRPATIREMQAALGLSSTSVVLYRLRAAEHRGLVSLRGGTHRMKLTRKGREAVRTPDLLRRRLANLDAERQEVERQLAESRASQVRRRR